MMIDVILVPVWWFLVSSRKIDKIDKATVNIKVTDDDFDRRKT